jgi:hypothetical protein
MRYRMWHTAVMALLIGAQGSLWTAEARASGLFDWLSRCGSNADPQVVYYPVTTVYQTSASDCEPTVSCQSPDALVYRTSWKKIPVTSYRPVLSIDPVTGCPVTVMKPCETYTWQAERARCGFFDRLFGRCDPPATQVQRCVPTPCSMPTEYVMGGVTSGCCGPAMSSATPTLAAPTPMAAPYYAPGPPSVLTVPPGSTSPAPMLAPQGMPPATGGVPLGPQPPAAADTRPTLKPAEVTPESPAGREPPRAGLPWNSPPANPANPAASNVPDMQPMPSLGPPIVNPESTRLNPVPDPDATPVTPAEQANPPQLLNPRDQVASSRTQQPWAYTVATWPASHRTSTDRTPPVQPRRDPRAWDESGWQSVRKVP